LANFQKTGDSTKCTFGVLVHDHFVVAKSRVLETDQFSSFPKKL
jgi:hypothetical protein